MLYQPRVNRKSGSRFLVTTYKFPIERKLETGSPKPGTVIVALLFLAATLSACVVPAPAPSRRAPSQRDDYSSAPPPPSRRLDSADAERLRRVMIPLLQAMDHPCRADQVRVGIMNQNEINAANAGNCEFYITAGLLRAPTTINCAVCWRMRSPMKISATWRKHRCLARDSIFSAPDCSSYFRRPACLRLSRASSWRAVMVALKSMPRTVMASISCAAPDIPKTRCSMRLPGFAEFPAAPAGDSYPRTQGSTSASRRLKRCPNSARFPHFWPHLSVFLCF